jgi:hypothetical protein
MDTMTRRGEPRRLEAAQWRAQAEDTGRRVDALLGDWLEGRRRGQKQPVIDFLFEYYAFRPAQLRRWSPGLGVILEGPEAGAFLDQREFARVEGGVALDPAQFPARRLKATRWVLSVLRGAQARAPHLGCYGMHEWAMVYKIDAPRHAQLPLRMAPEALAAFVESRPIRCTHYDAFRFFTEAARPLNRVQPTLEDMEALEQPACLHTNMDLYKWSHKLWPWVDSGLILDALELALRARTLDMKASPYDLSAQGLSPICVETAEGRAAYREAQEALMEASRPVRARLIEAVEALLGAVGSALEGAVEPGEEVSGDLVAVGLVEELVSGAGVEAVGEVGEASGAVGGQELV